MAWLIAWLESESSRAELLIKDILRRDPRYPKEAYLFVLAGCKKAFKKQPKTHISAARVLDALREQALSLYDGDAQSVLNGWGIRTCADFGEIVFNLVAVELLAKTPEDSKSDFVSGYNFDEAFGAAP